MSIDADFALQKAIRNNPVVRDIDPDQRREFRRSLILAALVVAMMLFSAWQHVSVMTTGVAVEKLRRDAATEQTIQRRLRLEHEMRRSPQQIESRARRELKMVPATDTLVIERVKPATPDKAVIAAVR
jgi:cell division protein FtsL